MSYFALVPATEALVVGYDPRKSNKKDWLPLNTADEMICKHFGVEPDPKRFYKSWKNQLWYSQNEESKPYLGTYNNYHIFGDANEYMMLYALRSAEAIYSLERNIDIIKEVYSDKMKEILQVIYDAGYVLIGVFNEN